MAENKETMELATATPNELAIPEDFASLVSEELDGLGSIRFDTVKIPSGGGIMFEIPGDDPANPDVAKELVGVIVGRQAKNGYWKDAFGQGEDQHPDCASADAKTGVDKYGECHDCATCPRNQFKADGSGKDCKNMQDLYILCQGEMLPIKLVVPPTSIANLRDYIAKRVITKGKRMHQVVTKLSLVKEKSRQGITYAKLAFAKVGDVDPSEAGRIGNASAMVKATIEAEKQNPIASASQYEEITDEPLPEEFT